MLSTETIDRQWPVGWPEFRPGDRIHAESVQPDHPEEAKPAFPVLNHKR